MAYTIILDNNTHTLYIQGYFSWFKLETNYGEKRTLPFFSFLWSGKKRWIVKSSLGKLHTFILNIKLTLEMKHVKLYYVPAPERIDDKLWVGKVNETTVELLLAYEDLLKFFTGNSLMCPNEDVPAEVQKLALNSTDIPGTLYI